MHFAIKGTCADALEHPHSLGIVYTRLIRRAPLAESFYLAMPYVSWQTVVIGDPLCAPFRKAPISTT